MTFYKERRRCRRPARTCRECCERKIKCSRTKPCTNCAGLQRECVYNTTSGANPPNKRGEYSLTQSTSEVACPPSLPQNFVDSLQSRRPSDDIPSSSHSPKSGFDFCRRERHSPLFHSKSNLDPKMVRLSGRIEDLERVFTTRALDHAREREIYSAQPMLRDGRAAVNKTRIFGRSHWLNTAYQFSEMQDFFGHQAVQCSSDIRSLRSDIEQLFIQCKFSARLLKSCRPSRCFPPALATMPTAPPRELAEQMGRLYFSRFESSFRILHIPSYWLEFNQYYRGPETGSLATLLKIVLVTAIGLGLQLEYGSHETRAAASEGVLLAQSWVSGLLEKDRLSVDGLQIQCLLILARQTLAIGGDLVWISVGTLLRTAMQMGLHRDPKHFPEMPLLLAEIRRRLWATILELTVQSSLDSGMPPMISLDDYDTAFPMEINDDKIKEESPICEPQFRSACTDVSFQLILLKAIPIRLQILRSVNGLQTEMFYPEVIDMNARLSSFCDECLASLQLSSADGHRFKSTMAEFLLKRFLLILHAPFAMRARSNQAFRVSLEKYLSSALTILSADLDPDFLHLLVVGGGFFETCVINAALIASNQIIASVETESQQSTSGEGKYTEKEALKGALMAAISLAERRLRAGETNVKLFSTLHMALGHVTALQTGISVPLGIAKHAKLALEKALVILRAQLGPRFPTTEHLGTAVPTVDGTMDDYPAYTYPVDFTSQHTPFY